MDQEKTDDVRTDHKMDDSSCSCQVCSCNRRGKLNVSSKSLRHLPTCVLNLRGVITLNLNYNSLKTLPDGFCDAFSDSLEALHIKGNDLRSLPETLGALRSLKALDVSENLLGAFPDSFGELSRLVSLKCVANKLTKLPDELGRMLALEEVYLDENKLKFLPDSFGKLAALTTLEISNNKLTKLPANFGDLIMLTSLNISYNSVTELPDSFGQLESLEDLDVSFCLLKFLPETFASSSCIRKLYADSNNFCALPPWISRMPCIEELSFEDNSLVQSAFDDDFGTNCSLLRHFNFGGNFMEYLPTTFGQLSQLEYVHLGSILHELERRNYQNGNWITKLPENFGHMRSLTQLRLDENQLVCLPDSFGELVNLESLDLGQNKLYKLPDNFGELRSLKVCQLSKNFLEMLPSNIGKLSALVEFRLDNNMITKLPDSFKELTQLKSLDLFNNMLEEIPHCLQYMKKLTYLELDENNFGVPLDEVPQIIYHTQYPPRNPDLANNWRGRSRDDRPPEELSVGFCPVNDSAPPEVDPNPSPETSEQVDKLVNALKQGSALWKSHNMADGPRAKFDHGVAQSQVLEARKSADTQMNSLAVQVSDIDMNGDQEMFDSKTESDDEWDEDDYRDGNESDGKVNAVDDEYEPEDWDKEMEESDPFSVYDDFPVSRLRSIPMPYGFPPNFLPADNHPTPIMRYSQTIERCFDGQFDDAD